MFMCGICVYVNLLSHDHKNDRDNAQAQPQAFDSTAGFKHYLKSFKYFYKVCFSSPGVPGRQGLHFYDFSIGSIATRHSQLSTVLNYFK